MVSGIKLVKRTERSCDEHRAVQLPT